MILPKSVSLAFLLSVFLLITGLPGMAASVVSPLAVTPDPIGADLQKSFIAAPGEASKVENGFVAFRKTFPLSLKPKKAVLHIFGDVRFLLWINGQPVHRGPSRFETRGPEYDSIDVGSALRAGQNTFAIVLMGNGSNSRMMKHAPGLTLRLDADGRTVLKTDDTWKWSDQTRYRPANVDWAQILDRIDARVEDGDWTLPAYDDRKWKPARKENGDAWGPLSARRIPLLRDTPLNPVIANGKKLPVTIKAGEKFEFQLDLLVQAYTVIELEADEGTELRFDYAEVDYVARAGKQTYITSDTHVVMGGSITVKTGRATITSFKLIERLYPFDIVGSFKSNDENLNKLWAVCARSCQIFSEDSYVDCADRERAEWMDDDPPAFDVTRTAMSSPGPDGKPHYADARLSGQMLRRTALTLQPDGWVKAHTCSDRFDVHAKMEDRACDWVEGARRYYDSTGDAALIKEIWPVIVKQMNYFLERRTSRGLVFAREWVFSGNPIAYVFCEGAGLNAFVYKALVDAAYLGNAIGEKSQAVKFDESSQQLAAAFNKVLWDEQNGTYYSGYYSEADGAKIDPLAIQFNFVSKNMPKIENNLLKPTMFPALWALDQGIVPESRRASVTKYLFDHRQEVQPEQWLMSIYYLCFQMYAANDPTFNTEVLETFRSKWKGMIYSPWHTTWEHLRDGSKAHIYGMFPGYFLSAYVLGVRPELPVSSRRIVIEPHLGDLTSVEGNVVTEFGVVPVSWKTNSGKLDFQFNLPAGVKGALRLPAGKLLLDGIFIAGKNNGTRIVTEVGPGKHQGSLTPN